MADRKGSDEGALGHSQISSTVNPYNHMSPSFSVLASGQPGARGESRWGSRSLERRYGLADLEHVSVPAGQPEADESLERPDNRCGARDAVPKSSSETPSALLAVAMPARRRRAHVADGRLTGR